MRSAKGRKHDRKEKQKTKKVNTTELSRKRRLANKARREEIYNINPSMKVVIIDQIPYVAETVKSSDGEEKIVAGGKITVSDDTLYVGFEPKILKSADEGETNVMEIPEAKTGRLRNIFKKW